MTSPDHLFRQAGALGVYSYYYQNDPSSISASATATATAHQNSNSYSYRSPIRTTTNSINHHNNIPSNNMSNPSSSKSDQSRLSKQSSNNNLFDHLQHHQQSNSDVPSRLTTPLSLDIRSNNGINTVIPTPLPPNNRLYEQPPPKLSFMSPSPLTEDELTIPTKELIDDASSKANNVNQPSNLDMLIRLMSMLTGKDKIGKCIQYGLRILIAYSSQIRQSSKLSRYNLLDIDFKSSNKNIIASLLRRPELLLILLLQQFETKFVGITKNLSIYRQMLRAGTVPFKVIKFANRLQQSVSLLQKTNESNSMKLNRLVKEWINMKSLSEFTALYYAWFDESLLAFKFGLFPADSWKRYHNLAKLHEPIAWYLNIIIGLKTQVEKLQAVSAQEDKVRINWQVKQRARKMISSIKSPNSPITLTPYNNSSALTASGTAYSNELKKLKWEKYLIQLEIAKLLCDFGYDSVIVWGLKMREEKHLMFGFGAAAISTKEEPVTLALKLIKPSTIDMQSRSSSPTRSRGRSFTRTPLGLKESNLLRHGSELSPDKSLSRSTSPLKFNQMQQKQQQISRSRPNSNSEGSLSCSQSHIASRSVSPSKRLSPTKQSFGSPPKRQRNTSTVVGKQTPQLSFKIFEDPVDYRATHSLSSNFSSKVQIVDNEVPEENKENSTIATKSHQRKHNRVTRPSKPVLDDLNVLNYPAFIQQPTSNKQTQGQQGQTAEEIGVLEPKVQLKDSWMLNLSPSRNTALDRNGPLANKLKVRFPSFITPPKKDKAIIYQYIQSLQQSSCSDADKESIDGALDTLGCGSKRNRAWTDDDFGDSGVEVIHDLMGDWTHNGRTTYDTTRTQTADTGPSASFKDSLDEKDEYLKVQISAYDSYQTVPSPLDKQYFTINNKPVPTSIFKTPSTSVNSELGRLSLKFSQVPITRIYGSVVTGHTVVLHLHNIFPYLYVEYKGPTTGNDLEVVKYLMNVKFEIDRALRGSYRRKRDNTNVKRRKEKRKRSRRAKVGLDDDGGESQMNDDDDDDDEEEEFHDDDDELMDDGIGNRFLSDVSVIKAIPFYGFHSANRPFIKISLLSAKYLPRLTRLLHDGAIFGRAWQPYESHIPYSLQTLSDYNLFGCNWIHLSKWYFRSPMALLSGDGEDLGFQPLFMTDFSAANLAKVNTQLKSFLERKIKREGLLGVNIFIEETLTRMSRCMLEVDSCGGWIVNRTRLKERIAGGDSDETGDTYLTSTKTLLDDVLYQRRTRGLRQFDPKLKLFDESERVWEKTKWIQQEELDDLLRFCADSSEKEWKRLNKRDPELNFDKLPREASWLAQYPTAFQSVGLGCFLPNVLESYLLQLTEDVFLNDHILVDWILFGITKNTQKKDDSPPSNLKSQSFQVLEENQEAVFPQSDSESSEDETEDDEDDFLGSIPHLEEPMKDNITISSLRELASESTTSDVSDIQEKADLDMKIFESTQAHKKQKRVGVKQTQFTLAANSNKTNGVVGSSKLGLPDAGLYQVCLDPPKFRSHSEMMKSFEVNHGMLKVQYMDPYYSRRDRYDSDPFDFGGKRFQLKCLDINGLESYSSHGSDYLDLSSVPDTSATWRYKHKPPEFNDVFTWCKQNQTSKTTKSQLLKSQVGIATQNMRGFKYPSLQTPVSRKKTDFNKLTLLTIEIHVNSRGDRFPDPQQDPVSVIFWNFDSVNYPFELGIANTGMFIYDPSASRTKWNKCSLSVPSQVFADEKEMIIQLISLVELIDPDILAGYEIHASSWGYILERFTGVYQMDLHARLSRVATNQINKKKDSWGYTHASGIKITGRHMLNIWRPLRSQLALNSYTLENVVFHMLHERIPHYDNQKLTEWFQSNEVRMNLLVIEYFLNRLEYEFKIIDLLELVERTSEESRLLGIDYYSVFSRGSQFKVESLLVRITKSENFVMISPSKKQVFKQDPLQWIPLILEPESSFYKSPLVVLDFQSLYPSLTIAYNYCYSTLLGRLRGFDPKRYQKIGVTSLKLPPGLLKVFEESVNVAPNGMMFMKSNVRKSTLGKMLTELLDARILVKGTMNSLADDYELNKLYNNRQLALKLIANVTYGYTSATFSGRMPNSDIADSIVSSARETLLNAISVIESNQEWGAKVVYGDTDSLFVYLPGKTKDEAFKLGRIMAKHITSINPAPVKLKFEKVYLPSVLMSKKRYVGYAYEREDQVVPKFDAKGIETVRRDGIPAQQKIVEKALRTLFDTNDISKVKDFVEGELTKIMKNKTNLKDFLFAKEVKLGSYKNEKYLPPGAKISKEKSIKDHRSEPQFRERVSYMVVKGHKDQILRDRCITPSDFVRSNAMLELDSTYYITKVLIPPLFRIFSLMGVDVKRWVDEMPKVLGDNGYLDRFQLHKLVVKSSSCINCNVPIKTERDGENNLCTDCSKNELKSIMEMRVKVKTLEEKMNQYMTVCKECAKRNIKNNNASLVTASHCSSEDCTVYFDRIKARGNTDREISRYKQFLDW
ncbi:hypothetical protein CANARDRAFT_5911 [[Candida] arabinofermentans NRRL YB-2248]|uniref:DNA polymerase zeta catalytic subunit n=1 Tax=[Candida] arabinofermentans NRRL YB-2248 TaxID=983967 RepID=A0A1E4T6L4_9ASCO|nr:hypothetical protein CANARDRAFT_5911 [[Candida] arabinofermentans NRRL YB-2248]